MAWRAAALMVSAVLLSIVAGCEHDENARPLSSAVLAPPRSEKPINSEPNSRTDQPGFLNNYSRSEANARRALAAPPQSPQDISQIVRDNVKPPGPGEEYTRQATSRATSGPTTIGTSKGVYYEIGGVVADVNGTPIYANKVLQLLEPVFAARAKELDPPQFRAAALYEIVRQVKALENDQLEYAAAERNLDQKDKDLADAMTTDWRRKQIAAAGGSLEVARQRAAARGETLEEEVQQQYRTAMISIYYQRKIMPRIQVSAADIRDYYYRNKDREFTELGSVRFRLIKIDKSKHGGADEARGLIEGLRNRIVKAGGSFEAIARSVNDDPRLLKSGGDLGTAIQEHAFAVAPVEDAVWKTPVGEVTPVVDAGNAFYIAKVEEKRPSVVQPFDDEAVQAKIEYQLRAEQFRKERETVIEALQKDAAVYSNESMINTAVEMAMQNYSRWAGAKPARG